MKRIFSFLLTFVFVGLACACPGTRRAGSLELGKVWAHMGSEWREVPPEAEIREETAWVKLATFRPGGEFVWLNCLLIKQGRIIRVSQGDPVVIYRGRWKSIASGAEVEYRQVFRTIKIVGQTLPGKLERSRVTWRGETLIFHGQQFSSLEGLEVKTFDFVVSQAAKGG